MSVRACLFSLILCCLPTGVLAQIGVPQERYIVVLREGLNLPENVAIDLAIETGGRVGHVYASVLHGFSITMPRSRLASLARDPRVDYIERDIPVRLFTQTVPSGIRRIFADDNPDIAIDGKDERVDVDVAVLDTGIDWEHPDLNVAGGTNCLQSTNFLFYKSYYCDDAVSSDDDHGHGTYVSGIVGAIDNGIGVVGVSLGARLWAVKVLDSQGSGTLSSVLAGLDWVTAKSGTSDNIEVINMSFGGSGSSQAMDDAVASAVGKGITVVVAAGNSDADAAKFTPANSPESFTVSAIADFDGEPGGTAAPTCYADQDDTLADFSNWGATVDIAAPGVCILSTVPVEDGEYDMFKGGTSVAAPHVAGGAALLASGDSAPVDKAGVDTLRQMLVNTGNFNWLDDSGDGIQEPLLDVSTFAVAYTSGESNGDLNDPPAANFNSICTELTCDFTDRSEDGDGSIVKWSWDFGDGATSAEQNPSHSYSATGTYDVSLTVTDDDGAVGTAVNSVSVSKSAESADDIYVWDIDMTDKVGGSLIFGRDLYTSVHIKRDSDSDGVPESEDEPVGSVTVTFRVTLSHGSIHEGSVQTGSGGTATYVVKNVSKGTHRAEVTNLVHDTYNWKSSLDVETVDTHTVK